MTDYDKALIWWSSLGFSEQQRIAKKHNYGNINDVSGGHIDGESISIMWFFEVSRPDINYPAMPYVYFPDWWYIDGFK